MQFKWPLNPLDSTICIRPQLLEIIRRGRSFENDAGRRTMLQVFNLLGNEGELVNKYRRLMAAALH